MARKAGWTDSVPGALSAPQLAGRIKRCPPADRFHLAHARVVLLHLLEQDERLPPAFEAAARRLSLHHHIERLRKVAEELRQEALKKSQEEILAGIRQGIQAMRDVVVEHNDDDPLRVTRRTLTTAVKRKAVAIGREMKRIDREILHLDRRWIQHELMILFLRHCGLYAVDPSRRAANEELAPDKRLVLPAKPGETVDQWRARLSSAVREHLAEAWPVDGGPVRPAVRQVLPEYVNWFYLRRCRAWSERGVALKAGKKTSRQRVRYGVGRVEKLFGLIADQPYGADALRHRRNSPPL